MREFSRKRKVRQMIFSVPVLILLCIILFFVAKGSWGVYKKYSLSKSELENSQADLTVLEEKKQTIEAKIEKLQTETGIEKEIRSKFDVAREGEKLIVIVEDKVTEEIVVEEKGFFGNFFTTIGGWFQ
ncbi:MAG: septum formation initiator family protein [Candidatus Paceibacterota bacterium]